MIVVAEGAMDFRPHDAALPDAPGPWRAAWSASVAVNPGRSRLLNIRGEAVLLNAPAGLAIVGRESLDEKPVLSGLRVEARPSAGSSSVLFDENGRLYRWTGSNANHIWETGASPLNLEAIGIDDRGVLVQRLEGDRWITELIDPERGPIWKYSGDLRGALPWSDSVLAITAERHSVIRLSAADGSTTWECAPDGQIAQFIAGVAGRLWLRTYEGELVSLDAETGVLRTRIRVPLAAVPEGVVDERGRLHLCTGASYTILDLAADGATVFSEILRTSGDDGPSLVFGSAAIPTVDDRLIFFDRRGRIYAKRSDTRQPLTMLWESDQPLLDCRVARGTLFILDREGRLSALRP